MRRTFSVGFGVAVLAAVAGVSHGQQAVQWRVEDGGNGHWYRFVATQTDWSSAMSAASAVGGHGATILSAQENAFVNSLVASPLGEGVLLGGRGTSGDCANPLGYAWITGEPMVFWAWNGGEPSGFPSYTECCVVLAHWNPSLWNDIPVAANWRGPSIIEWSADCDGNGVVDYGEILDGTLEDTNANGIPDCCEEGTSCEPCAGDLNDDNATNGADLSVLLGFWGLSGKSVLGDIDGNLVVDAADLSALLASWGPCP
jgi:hypothetical protein